MKYLIATVLLLLSGVLNAQELLQFDNDSQRDLYRSLTAELRCPQCQNQNIADSNAIVAVDMRQKTYELVRQGQERQQVLDYMINRYGDFVHYQPPLNRYTLWLWLSPVLMLTLLLGTAIYRRSKQSQQNVDTQSELNTELDQLIKRYRSKKP